MSILSSNPRGQWIKDSHFSRAKSRMLSSSISVTTTRFHNPIRISLVFWATELDMSTVLDLSIRSSRPLTFPGGQSKNGYRARWPIELSDLPVFQVKKKREKMEIKAVITTWSTKCKTPSRSQFVTDKKHCVAGRLMLFWYLKIYIDKKTFFFTLSSLIYLARDYCPSTARELNDLILNRIHVKKF